MPHGILNRLNLLFGTSGLLTIRRFRLIIVFPFDDPMLLFHLRNIQIRHMKSMVFLHPVLNFFIRSLCLSTCCINLIQINLNLDMVIRLLLGQTNNRLNSNRLSLLRFSGYLISYQRESFGRRSGTCCLSVSRLYYISNLLRFDPSFSDFHQGSCDYPYHIVEESAA